MDRASCSSFVLMCVACRGASPSHEHEHPPLLASSARTTPSSGLAASSSAAAAAGAPIRVASSEPHVLADCANAELRACLAPFLEPKLSPADIRGIAGARCFKGGRDLLAQAGDCLPLRAGTDLRSGKELRFSFVCSDICPDQGGALFAYVDVEEPACCKLGGEPIHIWPDSYVGCHPPESAETSGSNLITPDGKWRQISYSSCPGRKPVIYAEWPCEPTAATKPMLGIMRGPLPAGAHYAPNAKIYTESDCVPKFDAAAAERAVSEFDLRALMCVTSNRKGSASIRIRFSPKGDRGSAYLSEPSWLNNAQGRCIEQVYSAVTIPPFRDEMGEIFHGLSVN